MKSFVNFTNHDSSKWGSDQLKAAEKYGEVINIAFPAVPPTATKEEIQVLADKAVAEILSKDPCVVLAQGEFTLTFAVVERLKNVGVHAIVACTRRRTDEEVQQLAAAGLTREGMFAFMGFREY